MRINRDTLMDIAREAVRTRVRQARDLLGAYLYGSLLGESPVLAGTADVDLVFVHNSEGAGREIERLTDEVHLDIQHHTRRDYRSGRRLRQDPRLGPQVYACQILHDPQHFLDFIQASVRGHYHRPETVLERAGRLAGQARETWMGFYRQPPAPDPAGVAAYLTAVEQAVNAIALISGPPLPERRLLLEFPARAAAVDSPGLYHGAVGLLGGHAVQGEDVQAWLPGWETTYGAIPAEDRAPSLHPHRKLYYLRAMEAIVGGERPLDALWPLLVTWTRAARALSPSDEGYAVWEAACRQVDLLGEGIESRVAGLDAYLDQVEETLEAWGRERGV